MLVKITNFCSMGCSHCMENSTVQGAHMSREVFLQTLAFVTAVEQEAYQVGVPPFLLLSGGECTEHPDFLWFLQTAEEHKFRIILITNGMWLGQEELRKEVLHPSRDIQVQVTNDKRFYPSAPPVVQDRRVHYVDRLTNLLPLGRAMDKNGVRKSIADSGLPLKQAPSSFNLRSMTRSFGSFFKAVSYMRMRAATGMSGNCSPSISQDGSVVAGETNLCYVIGDVHSSDEQITENVLNMGSCNRCGLEKNLSPPYRVAIGLE